MLEARRPRDLRGFARVALVLAWVVFWLNTALFPCFETIAAAFGGHAGNVSRLRRQPADHPGDTHSGMKHHAMMEKRMDMMQMMMEQMTQHEQMMQQMPAK